VQSAQKEHLEALVLWSDSAGAMSVLSATVRTDGRTYAGLHDMMNKHASMHACNVAGSTGRPMPLDSRAC
jgi:hypothetical protein